MFYELYAELCRNAGKSPSGAATEMGVNKGSVSLWKKNGTVPGRATLQKIAAYFGVSMDYLLQQTPASEDDDSLSEYLEQLKNREEMRMLFKVAKSATRQDVEQAVRIIEAIRKP